ncbi:MAG TPA: CBS domain-containing protein [Candidatus Binataceae bacterium]|nr:CBS domain-containing protein [Candidatus Binataceae bacterium]
MKVKELMTREIKVCMANETLSRAAQLMWEYDCGFLPIIESDGIGALLGVVTDRDIAMATYTQGKPPSAIPLTAFVAHTIITCHEDDDITVAETLMKKHQVRRLPVIGRNGRLAGILSLNDLAREIELEKAPGRRIELSAADVATTLAAIAKPRLAHEGKAVIDLDYVE